MSIKVSLPEFGVQVVDVSSFPSPATVGDIVDIVANQYGMPIMYLGTSLVYGTDSVSINPVRISTVRTTVLAASLVAKASSGYLVEVRGQNEFASAQYIQIHDAASLPANGTVPKEIIKIDAGKPFSFTPVSHLLFNTGIVVCNSSTPATLTLGSANCWFSVDVEV